MAGADCLADQESMIYMRYRFRVGMIGWTTGDVSKRES
jgi:hypothetical protein